MFKPLRALAVMAVLALSAAFTHVRDTCVAAYRAVKHAAVYVFDLGMSLFAPEPQPASLPRYHQMRQFRQRLERRERPVITASWRMCPSC